MFDVTPECQLIVNYIIKKTNIFNESNQLRKKILLSIERLQKLLYFCDVEYMKKHNGKPMFKDDFYAWPSGPVIENVYYIFLYEDDNHPLYHKTHVTLTDEMKSIVNQVLEATKELDTIDLMNITNVTDGPWHQVYKDNDKEHKQIISKKEMYNFYLYKDVISKEKAPFIKRKKR